MRIGFVGGPGSGKSTQAALLFGHLKRQSRDVELVMEFAKAWIHEGRPLHKLDQFYFIGKQLRYEHRWLKHGIPHVITDSPMVVAAFHAEKYGDARYGDHLMKTVAFYGEEEPEHLIFLQRGAYAYQQAGRFQNEEQARAMDAELLAFVMRYYTADQVSHITVGDDASLFELGMTLTS